MTKKEHWKPKPDEHDFPAASAYLSLIISPSTADVLVQRLRAAETTYRQAKDLLRASQLPLLSRENEHVSADLKKINKGVLLSPVLLVRGALDERIPLTIADGYHRVCASYYVDEDADIPCRIADLTLA